MLQDEEKVQTRRRQADAAIRLAMANRWEEAIDVNKSILSLFPNDADSHNRLGKAYMELGRYPEAKKSYKKALDLDATNTIARKNLDRINALIKSGGGQAAASHVDPKLFIEEMGKTAVTTLTGASPKVLNALDAGDQVQLRRDGNAVRIETSSGEAIGSIEPKLASRLIKLLDGGNEYAAAVTSLAAGECKIIIRETFQHPSQAGRPSFPPAGTNETRLRPYTKERLLRHEENADEPEKERDEISADDDGESDDSWDGETVVQEGHVRLNDAAAAEDVDDDMEE